MPHMIFLMADTALAAVTEGGGLIDPKGALANALGTIIGGIFLTVFYFALAQKILRPPRLSGTWILESTILQTRYNPFRGMVLRYKVLLLQSGPDLRGTAEKVYESSDKVREFTGVNRTTATLEGTIRKAYVGRTTIFFHVAEEGEQRSFSWVAEARCQRFGRHMNFRGYFSSTAGDASGIITLKQIRIPNHIDDYWGLPLRWFSRLIEALTAHAYRNEWNELRAKISNVAKTAEELWRTYNCHLLVAGLVIAEDRRFNAHGGADPIGMCRAFYQTVFNGKVQGGSTIEQQLVRLLTSDHRRSVKRKFKEVVLAVRLHRVLRKDQVPVAYLASAYYGWHMNGVVQAAERLTVDLKNPSIDAAAQLVARIRYPEPRHADSTLAEQIARREKWIAGELRARPYLLY
jgi:hypothetical protein